MVKKTPNGDAATPVSTEQPAPTEQAAPTEQTAPPTRRRRSRRPSAAEDVPQQSTRSLVELGDVLRVGVPAAEVAEEMVRVAHTVHSVQAQRAAATTRRRVRPSAPAAAPVETSWRHGSGPLPESLARLVAMVPNGGVRRIGASAVEMDIEIARSLQLL